MAEVLVCKNRGPAPAGKEEGWWKDDDPVVVMPDGWPWGPEELDTSKFEIAKFPGVLPETIEAFLENWPGKGRRKFKIKLIEKKIIDRETDATVLQL
jgi:hypothetical protein